MKGPEVNTRNGPIPPPFQMMNSPVPRCSEAECGRPVHLDPPPGHAEWCAHTFVPAIIGMLGMDRPTKGVDWFVVGARDSQGHRQVITVAEDESCEARKRMLDRAIADLDNAFRLPPPWASALMPASITHFFTTAIRVDDDSGRAMHHGGERRVRRRRRAVAGRVPVPAGKPLERGADGYRTDGS